MEQKKEIRDHEGHHLCDLVQNDVTCEIKLEIKQGNQKYEISFHEILLQYYRMKIHT